MKLVCKDNGFTNKENANKAKLVMKQGKGRSMLWSPGSSRTMDDPIPHMEVREKVQNAMLKPPMAMHEEHTAPVFIQEGTQLGNMDHGHHHSKPKDEGSTSHSFDSDAASRQRRERRSPSPPTRKRSPTYPPPNDVSMGDSKDKKRRRKRTPTPPTLSLDSSSTHAKISCDESFDSYESTAR